MEEYFKHKLCSLYHGDCIDIGSVLQPNSIDTVITDSPYGIKFMSKKWDHGVPAVPFWEEIFKVTKPGGYLFAFGGTRTFHRLACNIEDAGWNIIDCIGWVYGVGFPKGLNVSKAIDKHLGAERDVVGYDESRVRPNRTGKVLGEKEYDRSDNGATITAPKTKEAIEWDGWGTALKPAWEPIIVARKPLEGTVAENILKYGVGAMNIDASRVGIRTKNESGWSKTGAKASENRAMSGNNYDREPKDEVGVGRFPANFIHDGSEEVVSLFPDSKSTGGQSSLGAFRNGKVFGKGEDIRCNADPGFGDNGSASRFFYCAKASKRDRDEMEEDIAMAKQISQKYGMKTSVDSREGRTEGERTETPKANFHPCVKPTKLMRYLCKLANPPNGVILDPFMGSGSTGKAAILEGFKFVGIELEKDYLQIAKRRINYVISNKADETDQNEENEEIELKETKELEIKEPVEASKDKKDEAIDTFMKSMGAKD